MTGRESLFSFVRANADKPHRCPQCHGIVAYPMARWWRIYRCGKCGVRWWRGWNDYGLRARWRNRRV